MPTVASLKYPKRAAPPDAGRSGAVADLTRGGGATFIDTTIIAFGFPPDVRSTKHDRPDTAERSAA